MNPLEILARSDPAEWRRNLIAGTTTEPGSSQEIAKLLSKPIQHHPNKRGREISQELRASIITKRYSGDSFPTIGRSLGLNDHTCAKIYRHAVETFQSNSGTKDSLLPQQPTLINLLQPNVLHASPRPGRPSVLTEYDKDQLIATTKKDWVIRHMTLSELQKESGLDSVSKQTCLNALHERGIKSYKDNQKPPLTDKHKQKRLTFAQARLNWEADKEWADYCFTDEMGVTLGGSDASMRCWREKKEKWEEDCMGRKRIQGATIMCWGMIGYDYKGAFHVWEAETEQERQDAINEIEKSMRLRKKNVKEEKQNGENQRNGGLYGKENWRMLVF